jgi:hypothetical protein
MPIAPKILALMTSAPAAIDAGLFALDPPPAHVPLTTEYAIHFGFQALF